MTPTSANANRFRHARGFSLVELMVSIVAGLLVIAGLLAFTVSSVRSNAEFVTATRLTQELRGTMDYTTRELRRAGYDQDYMEQISRKAGSTDQSDFSPIRLEDDNCVIYAYDRQPGEPGEIDPDNGELRGIRWVEIDGVGVVEVATSDATNDEIACDDGNADYDTYPSTCNGAWCALTDHRTLNISEFVITDNLVALIPGNGTSSVPMRIREFDVRMTGNLVGNPDVERGVESKVRVRADCLRLGMTAANQTACNAVPTS